MPLFSRTISRRRRRLLIPAPSRTAEGNEPWWPDFDDPPCSAAETANEPCGADAPAHDAEADDAFNGLHPRSDQKSARRAPHDPGAEPKEFVAVAAPADRAPPLSGDALSEVGELIAAARTLQRQFDEHARRQLHLMRRITDSLDGEMRTEVLGEIERLQQIVGEAGTAPPSAVQSPACAPLATPRRRTRLQKSAVAEKAPAVNPTAVMVSLAPLETRGSTAHYGRMAQRIAAHQQQRAGRLGRFWRWMIAPR